MAMVQLQNTSIRENSVQLRQFQTDLSRLQNAILSQNTMIEQLEGNRVAGNATAHDHSSRIAILELELTANQNMVPNHNDTIKQLDKSLNA